MTTAPPRSIQNSVSMRYNQKLVDTSSDSGTRNEHEFFDLLIQINQCPLFADKLNSFIAEYIYILIYIIHFEFIVFLGRSVFLCFRDQLFIRVSKIFFLPSAQIFTLKLPIFHNRILPTISLLFFCC